MSAGTCGVSFCDREARVNARTARIAVCKAHYVQDWKGLPFTPIKRYIETDAFDNGRICNDCDRFKPWDEFYKRSNTKRTGKSAYMPNCKVCYRAAIAVRKELNNSRSSSK